MQHTAQAVVQTTSALTSLAGMAGRLWLLQIWSSLILQGSCGLRADEPPLAPAAVELELRPSSAKLEVLPLESTPVGNSAELELSTSHSSREGGKKAAPGTASKQIAKQQVAQQVSPETPAKAEPPPVEVRDESSTPPNPVRLPKSYTPAPLPSRSGALKLEVSRLSSDDDEQATEKSISAKSVASPRSADRDFSNERQEGDELPAGDALVEPDDVPLDQDEHPFDAPPAASQPGEARRAAPIVPGDSQLFSQRELRIQTSIQACLNYYLTHPENTTRRGPWALMHAALPLGVESEVLAGGRRVNTLGWLAFNGTCGRQNMFQPTRQGFRPNVGPGVQGHEGQFLAILAQAQVGGDYPLQINRRRYTVMDLARYEMATCREKSELTFKLIGLSFYLEPNQQWRDNRGRVWSLEKMLVEEMAQPINGAACGGVHRLMGLSYAIIQREEAGQPIVGPWQRAEAYLNDYINYTMSLQNPDGSFSTNWLESRGMQPDVERKVQTTGHILEWLVYTFPDEQLRSPRIHAALEFLLNTVGAEPRRDWPIGPRSHALRAMSIYSQRVHGAQPGQMKSYLAGAAPAQLTR